MASFAPARLRRHPMNLCARGAHKTYSIQRKAGTLSRQFYEVMTEAGLVEKKSHRKAAGEERGPGRSGKRVTSKISFHSLRHTTTSLLKNAGVSPAIAEEFVGHDSTEMNWVDAHIKGKAMKAAADLPDVLS